MQIIFGYIGHTIDPGDTHDYHHQYYGILAFAANNSMGKVQFVMETEPEDDIYQRDELQKLLMKVQRGDTIIVTELRRLGNSIIEIVNVVAMLCQMGVKVISVKDDELWWSVEPKVINLLHSVVGDTVGACGNWYHIYPKQEEGKSAGRPAGTLGKSRLDGHEGEIAQYLKNGATKAEIGRMYKISRAALTDFLRSRKIFERTMAELPD